MLTTFHDPVTRERVRCVFHEISTGPNSAIGVAHFYEHNLKAFCFVPLLVLGETPDKQFTEADWLRAKSFQDAKRLVNENQVSWMNLGSGDIIENLTMRNLSEST